MNYLYNWYNEPENQTVRIDIDELSNLIISCLSKISGNSQELKIEVLTDYGFKKSSIKKWLYKYTDGGIEVKNLIKICDFLNIFYGSLNHSFLALGQSGKKSNIKTLIQPTFPINLNIPELGTILGAQASDASLTPRTWIYYNNKKELREFVHDAIKKTFGNIHSQPRTNAIQFPAFVARAIHNTGIPYGSKTKLNYPLPNILMEGSFEMQKNYLSQRYSDEGTIRFLNDGRNRWNLVCYQALDLDYFLSKDDFCNLRNLILKLGRIKLTPSGTKCKVYSKISNLQNFKLETHKPNFLLNDQKLLRNFGIKSYIHLVKVKYYYKSNKLSGYWQSIVHDQKDVIKFHDYIGFNDSEKNNKLRKCMKMIN